ncbi:MAG: S-layer homology domain-containing protein [Ruminiclostridium sp.]
MKKTISGVILAGVILLSSTFSFAQAADQSVATAAGKFTDISGHWAETSIQKLIDKDAIPFGQEKFIPGKAITRSEFVVMLHNAMDIQIAYLKAPDIKDYFDDVKQEATYASALIDLVTANIIEGKGSFKPDGTLSREEMVHYIMNAYKYKMGDKYALINIKPPFFSDDSAVTPIYSGEVGRAVHYKLVVGSGKNLFYPKSNTTRAEAAVVISKLVSLVEKQNSEVVIKPSVSVKDNSLEMKLSIINNSKDSVIFNHSSGQKFDFVLLDADKKELYKWSEGRAFTMMLTSTSIETGKTIEYSDILDGDQYKAIKDKIVYLKAYIIGSSDSFVINTNGYELKIK